MSADRSTGGKGPARSSRGPGKSGGGKPGYGKSGGGKPSGAKSGSAKSGYGKSGGAKSSAGKSGAGKSGAGKSGGAKSSAGKSGAGKTGYSTSSSATSSSGAKRGGGSGSRDRGRPSTGGREERRPSGQRSPRTDKPRSTDALPKASPFDEELIALARTERVLPGDVKADLEVFHPRVADLLGAAYLLVAEAPEEALRYAMEAKRHASRSPVVREACGMAAYYAGQFDVAIKELRTVRRLTGRDDMVPLIADCERALGNPQKAIDLASEPLRLTEDNQVELRIVAAGARMDLGQPEAAALLLRIPLLESNTESLSSARLKYAYAEAMLAAGDVQAARVWFARSAAADVEGDVDADERLEALVADR